MACRVFAFLLLAGVAGMAQVTPRDSAAAYPVHLTTEVGELGARIVPAEALKNATEADLAACCVVVEVGVYPKAEGTWVGPERFQLHVAYPGKKGGSDIKTAKPSVVATMLQQIAAHSIPREQTVTVTGGTRQAATESIGPDPSLNPGATEHDRYVANQQLSSWVLGDGMAKAPVAGWLYFPARLKDGAVLSLVVGLNGTIDGAGPSAAAPRVPLTLPLRLQP